MKSAICEGSSLEDLNRRLESAEKEGRRLRLATGVVLAAAAAITLVGARPNDNVFKEIRTRRLAIVDDRGAERIVLDMQSRPNDPKTTYPRVALLGPKGHTMIQLAAGVRPDTTSSFEMFDALRRERLVFTVNENDSCQVLFRQRDGKPAKASVSIP